MTQTHQKSNGIDEQDHTKVGLREEFNIDFQLAKELFRMADDGRDLGVSNMVFQEILKLRKIPERHLRVRKLDNLTTYLFREKLLPHLTPFAAFVLRNEHKTNGRAVPKRVLLHMMKNLRLPIGLEKLVLQKEKQLLQAVEADDELKQIFKAWNLPNGQTATQAEKEDAIRKLTKMKCDIWGIKPPKVAFYDGPLGAVNVSVDGSAFVLDTQRFAGAYFGSVSERVRPSILLICNAKPNIYASLSAILHLVPHEIDHYIQDMLMMDRLPDYKLSSNIENAAFKDLFSLCMGHMNDEAYRSALMERWAYRCSKIWRDYADKGIESAIKIIEKEERALLKREACHKNFWKRMKQTGYHVCS